MQFYSDYNDLGFLMALTNDTVLLFLLLMPGFVASIVLNTVIVRKPPDGLLLVIEALVFSFVIYACLGVFSGQFLVTVGPSGVITPGPITRWSLAGVLGLSVVLPLVLGALLTHDYLFWVLGKLKITRRTGRASVWLDVFVEQQRCVIVNFTDGRRLFGWPEFYSDDANEGMLYLSSPKWLTDDGKYIPFVGMRGFLISKREVIESIIFTNLGRDNIELEEYGEKSSTPAHDDHGGTESSCHQRTESAPDSTDKASSTAPSPAAEKERVSGGHIGE
jgi:hypothetical protein